MPAPPTVQTDWKPTGRIRLRPTWFGRVIAEIEERCETGPANPLGFIATGSKTRWRRPRLSDCTRPMPDREEADQDRAALKRAEAKARKDCAEIAAGYAGSWEDEEGDAALIIADAIRARGEEG